MVAERPPVLLCCWSLRSGDLVDGPETTPVVLNVSLHGEGRVSVVDDQTDEGQERYPVERLRKDVSLSRPDHRQGHEHAEAEDERSDEVMVHLRGAPHHSLRVVRNTGVHETDEGSEHESACDASLVPLESVGQVNASGHEVLEVRDVHGHARKTEHVSEVEGLVLTGRAQECSPFEHDRDDVHHAEAQELSQDEDQPRRQIEDIRRGTTDSRHTDSNLKTSEQLALLPC